MHVYAKRHMDYASVISIASTDAVVRKLEVNQNNALRIIFKISFNDHIPVEKLRERAGIESIAERHKRLLRNYYEKALITNNPLMNQLFKNYKVFKIRKLINESLAIRLDGSVDPVKLNLIRKTNMEFLIHETHRTTLCEAEPLIREIILDSFGEGHAGTFPS